MLLRPAGLMGFELLRMLIGLEVLLVFIGFELLRGLDGLCTPPTGNSGTLTVGRSAALRPGKSLLFRATSTLFRGRSLGREPMLSLSLPRSSSAIALT